MSDGPRLWIHALHAKGWRGDSPPFMPMGRIVATTINLEQQRVGSAACRSLSASSLLQELAPIVNLCAVVGRDLSRLLALGFG